MNKSPIFEEVEKITDEYGQLHEDHCELNLEQGSFDGCTCAMEHLNQSIEVLITERERQAKLKVWQGLVEYFEQGTSNFPSQELAGLCQVEVHKLEREGA